MRQISLRVRAALSTKWGSTVNMALWEGFITRCIPLLSSTTHGPLRKNLLIFPSSSSPAASSGSTFCFHISCHALLSWHVLPLLLPQLSHSDPVLKFSSSAFVSAPLQRPAPLPQPPPHPRLQHSCYNAIIHASAGRRWKRYLASASSLTCRILN